jgi:hypothetical protein
MSSERQPQKNPIGDMHLDSAPLAIFTQIGINKHRKAP